MQSNLIYYTLSLGFGIAAAWALSDYSRRKPWMYPMAIALSVFWFFTLSASYPQPIDSLSGFFAVFGIERLLALYSGRTAAALFLLPLLWSLTTFNILFFELRQLLKKNHPPR